MLTYSEAKEKLENSRTGRRKLKNNTYLEWRGVAAIAVRLHKTDVVTLHEDGSYTLNSGGWRTVTTKDRINTYAPVSLFSDKGEWYVRAKRDWDGPQWGFADGMSVAVYGDGKLHVSGAVADRAPVRRKVARMVREYVDGFAESVKGKGLTAPGPGDCWGCCLAAEGPRSIPTRDGSWHATGPKQSLPPGTRDITGVDHYLSHFEEKYYVPSLVWRAVQRCGDPAFVWSLIDARVRRGDVDMLMRELKAYFRPLMPALVDEVARRQGSTRRGEGV